MMKRPKVSAACPPWQTGLCHQLKHRLSAAHRKEVRDTTDSKMSLSAAVGSNENFYFDVAFESSRP